MELEGKVRFVGEGGREVGCARGRGEKRGRWNIKRLVG